METITHRSQIDREHPCYALFKGYMDKNNIVLRQEDPVYYTLDDTDELFIGYIELKDLYYEGYKLESFPYIKQINGKTKPSTGLNCIRVYR